LSFDAGALLVYDITDVDSFARVKNWVRELRKIVGDDISICIAGNKKDLQKNAHVTMEEADEYAASVGAQHIRTSAKLNQGVNEVFLALVQSACLSVRRHGVSLSLCVCVCVCCVCDAANTWRRYILCHLVPGACRGG
jgi:GTPase SAR1 family protein